jgi:hypothetical protein
MTTKTTQLNSLHERLLCRKQLLTKPLTMPSAKPRRQTQPKTTRSTQTISLLAAAAARRKVGLEAGSKRIRTTRRSRAISLYAQSLEKRAPSTMMRI